MNVIRTGYVTRLCGFALAAVVAGCAMPVPRQAQVVTMGAHTPAPDSAFPAEGGIWRLDDSEFKALGPVPVETAPGEAASIPGSFSRLPAGSQDYRSYGYAMPLPFLIYYGPRFSFAYRYPGYTGRAHRTLHTRVTTPARGVPAAVEATSSLSDSAPFTGTSSVLQFAALRVLR